MIRSRISVVAKAPLLLGFLATAGSALAADHPYEASPLTRSEEFTEGIEGPACDRDGFVYAVNFAREGTIGKVHPATARGEVFVALPGKSVGNGIVFDRMAKMYV